MTREKCLSTYIPHPRDVLTFCLFQKIFEVINPPFTDSILILFILFTTLWKVMITNIMVLDYSFVVFFCDDIILSQFNFFFIINISKTVQQWTFPLDHRDLFYLPVKECFRDSIFRWSVYLSNPSIILVAFLCTASVFSVSLMNLECHAWRSYSSGSLHKN